MRPIGRRIQRVERRRKLDGISAVSGSMFDGVAGELGGGRELGLTARDGRRQVLESRLGTLAGVDPLVEEAIVSSVPGGEFAPGVQPDVRIEDGTASW